MSDAFKCKQLNMSNRRLDPRAISDIMLTYLLESTTTHFISSSSSSSSSSDDIDFDEILSDASSEINETVDEQKASEVETPDSPKQESVCKRIKLEEETEFLAYNDEEFLHNFRMSKETADFITGKLTEANVLYLLNAGRKTISPHKAVLVVLWYLGNQETFRQIAERFSITISSVHRIVHKVVTFLKTLASAYFKWPENKDISAAKSSSGMRSALGAIGVTHITLNKPYENHDFYLNKKGTYSVTLQAVVDNDNRFLDVFCGEAGSVNDDELLLLSPIFKEANDTDIFGSNRFLLCSSDYPKNVPWLVLPFEEDNLSENQKLFNAEHEEARKIVDEVFGLLKSRFRRLQHFDNRNIEFISNAVEAACILHNICISRNEVDFKDFEETEEVVDDEDQEIFSELRRNVLFKEMFESI